MGVVGDLSVIMAVISLAVPEGAEFVPDEFAGYLPALHLMAAVMFLTPGISDTAWRYCGAAFFLGYAAKVMLEIPHTQQHLTLWLNVMFGVNLLISSHTRLLHSVAFLSAHTLLFAYLAVLFFVGHGSLLMGFYLLDVGQYKGDVLKATTHTLILHVWPMLMVHTELARFHSDLQQMYAGARESWLGFVWMAIVSPAILPMIYDQVQLQKHGSPEQAMHFNYKVPLDIAPILLKVTWGMLPPIQLATYRFFANAVMPEVEIPAEKKSN